jgi:hypothetical protein
MTPPRPQPPRTSENVPKPYDFVSFPDRRPPLRKPIGHHQYFDKRIHGTLHLELSVATAVHVSTGITMMGSDVGQSGIPLIKTMQTSGNKLTIPGSSLKGVVRSIYEAITNSTLGVVTNKYKSRMPDDRLPCRKKEQLCPASQIFGALDWQGLVSFRDARCVKTGFVPGFMPSLYCPRPDQRRKYFNPVGRKFYYHATKAIGGGQQGIPVQQANQQYVFEATVQVHNLSLAEFGTLLIALGQDREYPLALKVGAGKPIGMGTMNVKLTAIAKPQSIADRYTDYNSETPLLTDEALEKLVKNAIATARQEKLVELLQLQQLHRILTYPTDRQAPSGMY